MCHQKFCVLFTKMFCEYHKNVLLLLQNIEKMFWGIHFLWREQKNFVKRTKIFLKLKIFFFRYKKFKITSFFVVITKQFCEENKTLQKCFVKSNFCCQNKTKLTSRFKRDRICWILCKSYFKMKNRLKSGEI